MSELSDEQHDRLGHAVGDARKKNMLDGNPNSRVLVAFSGGIDSTALLTRAARKRGPSSVLAVSAFYGQRHKRELEAARSIAQRLGVTLRSINLDGLLSGSALLGHDGATPPPADQDQTPTVVHGRNLLIMAAIVAQAEPADSVWFGANADDHTVYADCRPQFVEGVALAAAAYSVAVYAPFVNMTKRQIVLSEPDAPFDLAWSCYMGGSEPCNLCAACAAHNNALGLAA